VLGDRLAGDRGVQLLPAGLHAVGDRDAVRGDLLAGGAGLGDRLVALEHARVGRLDPLERDLRGHLHVLHLDAEDLHPHLVEQRLLRIHAGAVGLAQRDAQLGEQVARGGGRRGDHALPAVGDEDDLLGRGDRQRHAVERETVAAAGGEDEVVGAEPELLQRLVHRQRRHVHLALDAVDGEPQRPGAVEDHGGAVGDLLVGGRQQDVVGRGLEPLTGEDLADRVGVRADLAHLPVDRQRDRLLGRVEADEAADEPEEHDGVETELQRAAHDTSTVVTDPGG
jgi:hypothetical protein